MLGYEKTDFEDIHYEAVDGGKFYDYYAFIKHLSPFSIYCYDTS